MLAWPKTGSEADMTILLFDIVDPFPLADQGLAVASRIPLELGKDPGLESFSQSRGTGRTLILRKCCLLLSVFYTFCLFPSLLQPFRRRQLSDLHQILSDICWSDTDFPLSSFLKTC